jgi:RND family efflux transporter MFP subunit
MRKIVFGLACLLVLAGCSKKSKYSYLTDKPLPVEIEVVGEGSRMVEDTYVGEIRPDVEISLVFPLGGQLNGIYVKSGDYVKAGQLIASVDSTQAKALLESADAVYAQAQDGYRRLKPLHAEGGISDVKWVEMETNLEKARSMTISARKRFEDCELRAPQDGIVTLSGWAVGQMVSPGQPIGELVNLSSYYMEFTVPESEVGSLVQGTHILVTQPSLDKQFDAEIFEKGISATRLAHTYRVKARILSPEATQYLLPGMVCRAVVSHHKQNGFIISAGCIQTQQRGHSVWALKNGRAERRMVTISDFVENGVLISEGIELGDTIISKGYQKMYNGAAVTF